MLKEWISRDPAETVVLNEAAVIILTEFADTIAPQIGPFNRARPVSDYKAWLTSRPSHGPSEDAKLVATSPNFRHQVLSVYLNDNWIAMYESSPQFQALQSAAERRPAEKKAREEEAKRHVTVFGIALGMAPERCSVMRNPPCIINEDSDAFTRALTQYGAAADHMWTPALLGDRVNIAVDERPGWMWPPAAPIVAHVWNGNVVAVRMHVNANDGDFRGDLVEKFGPPSPEKQLQFRNTYGKTWTVPSLEWETDGVHVQFVPDGKQGDEGALGVLVIELDVAYKARRESEMKGRKNRPKL